MKSLSVPQQAAAERIHVGEGDGVQLPVENTGSIIRRKRGKEVFISESGECVPAVRDGLGEEAQVLVDLHGVSDLHDVILFVFEESQSVPEDHLQQLTDVTIQIYSHKQVQSLCEGFVC